MPDLFAIVSVKDINHAMKVENDVIEMAYYFFRRSRNIIKELPRKKDVEIIGMAFVIKSMIKRDISPYMT